MNTTTTDDPIRDEVERWLQAVVDVSIGAPARAVGRVRRCVSYRVRTARDRMLQPVRIARSLFDVAAQPPPARAPKRMVGGGPVREPAPAPGPSTVSAPPVDVEAPMDLEPAAVTPAAPAPVVATVVPDVGPVTAPPALVDSGEPEDLPIEEYESLAASHVVARLTGLTPDELRAVQRFETAHRGRRTVLGRIEQLLAAE